MNCRKCSGEIVYSSKEQTKLKMCVECYRQYSRRKRRRIRKTKGKQIRVCPSCTEEHQSPGYCGEYCSKCFTILETSRKSVWRESNRQKDRDRVSRWRKANPEKWCALVKEQYHSGGADRIRNFKISRKKMFVDESGGACIECGYDKNLSCLVWHHRDPNNKHGCLSEMIRNKSISDGKIRREIKKCDLLCRNCHGETHNPTFE